MMAMQTDRARPRRLLGRFAKDKSGVTATEFALVVPIAMSLICVFIDAMMVMFVQTAVEGGVREASRYAMTGYTEPGKTREQRIAEIVKEHTFGLIPDEHMTVTIRVYKSLQDVGKPETYTDTNGNGRYDAGEPFIDQNGNGQWDADMGVANSAGGPGDVVSFNVEYRWDLWTPLAAAIWTGGTITMAASVVVRNEPF
jgi:Flp pilus assembly protein TadG